MAATRRRLRPLAVGGHATTGPEETRVTDSIAVDPIPPGHIEEHNGSVPASRTRARGASFTQSLRRWMEPTSPVLTYVGVGLIAAGIALIAYTWGRVAGTLAVPLQMPYVASGGVAGLAFVVIGSNLISIASKRRDAATRARQLEELSVLMRSIADHVNRSDRDR